MNGSSTSYNTNTQALPADKATSAVSSTAAADIATAGTSLVEFNNKEEKEEDKDNETEEDKDKEAEEEKEGDNLKGTEIAKVGGDSEATTAVFKGNGEAANAMKSSDESSHHHDVKVDERRSGIQSKESEDDNNDADDVDGDDVDEADDDDVDDVDDDVEEGEARDEEEEEGREGQQHQRQQQLRHQAGSMAAENRDGVQPDLPTEQELGESGSASHTNEVDSMSGKNSSPTGNDGDDKGNDSEDDDNVSAASEEKKGKAKVKIENEDRDKSQKTDASQDVSNPRSSSSSSPGKSRRKLDSLRHEAANLIQGLGATFDAEKYFEQQQALVDDDSGPRYFQCDVCDRKPLEIRWHCVECPDFDMCDNCHENWKKAAEEKGRRTKRTSIRGLHELDHMFEKLWADTSHIYNAPHAYPELNLGPTHSESNRKSNSNSKGKGKGKSDSKGKGKGKGTKNENESGKAKKESAIQRKKGQVKGQELEEEGEKEEKVVVEVEEEKGKAVTPAQKGTSKPLKARKNETKKNVKLSASSKPAVANAPATAPTTATAPAPDPSSSSFRPLPKNPRGFSRPSSRTRPAMDVVSGFLASYEVPKVALARMSTTGCEEFIKLMDRGLTALEAYLSSALPESESGRDFGALPKANGDPETPISSTKKVRAQLEGPDGRLLDARVVKQDVVLLACSALALTSMRDTATPPTGKPKKFWEESYESNTTDPKRIAEKKERLKGLLLALLAQLKGKDEDEDFFTSAKNTRCAASAGLKKPTNFLSSEQRLQRGEFEDVNDEPTARLSEIVRRFRRSIRRIWHNARVMFGSEVDPDNSEVARRNQTILQRQEKYMTVFDSAVRGLCVRFMLLPSKVYPDKPDEWQSLESQIANIAPGFQDSSSSSSSSSTAVAVGKPSSLPPSSGKESTNKSTAQQPKQTDEKLRSKSKAHSKLKSQNEAMEVDGDLEEAGAGVAKIVKGISTADQNSGQRNDSSKLSNKTKGKSKQVSSKISTSTSKRASKTKPAKKENEEDEVEDGDEEEHDDENDDDDSRANMGNAKGKGNELKPRSKQKSTGRGKTAGSIEAKLNLSSSSASKSEEMPAPTQTSRKSSWSTPGSNSDKSESKPEPKPATNKNKRSSSALIHEQSVPSKRSKPSSSQTVSDEPIGKKSKHKSNSSSSSDSMETSAAPEGAARMRKQLGELRDYIMDLDDELKLLRRKQLKTQRMVKEMQSIMVSHNMLPQEEEKNEEESVVAESDDGESGSGSGSGSGSSNNNGSGRSSEEEEEEEQEEEGEEDTAHAR